MTRPAKRQSPVARARAGRDVRSTAVTLLLAAVILFGGSWMTQRVAARIEQSGLGLEITSGQPQYLLGDYSGYTPHLQPFDFLNEANHRPVNRVDIENTTGYLDLQDWGVRILSLMPGMHQRLGTLGSNRFWLYRTDGQEIAPGPRGSALKTEWLLSETSSDQLTAPVWTIRMAHRPGYNLVWFRVESPQYLISEIQRSERAEAQARLMSDQFIGQLRELVDSQRIKNEAPMIRLPAADGDFKHSYDYEGMILHVNYENNKTGESFTVFYNLGLSEIAGFTYQAAAAPAP